MFSAILQLASKIFCFTSYVSNKESYPQPLTPKQEDEYLKKYAQGDGNAREILIKYNLHLHINTLPNQFHLLQSLNAYCKAEQHVRLIF